MATPRASKLRAIGVYPSAGGPTLGIQRHIKVMAHFTDGKFAYETRQANFPKIEEYTDPEEWPHLKADFMYCAPPCAPFSSLGKRGHGWENDPKIAKAYQALEAGLNIEPTIWMQESVPGFYKKAQDFIEPAQERWMAKGYSITHFFTGGILHGVPQRRIRWHMFAHKVKLVFPKDTGKIVRTMREAWEVYGPPQEGLGQAKGSARVESLQRWAPDGCKYRDVYTWLTGIEDSEVGLYAGVPHFSLRRGEWDRSVPTLVGTPRVYMPKPERRLYSVGEGLVMCGYPRSFKLVSRTVRDAYDQVAKGILPPLADYLGKIAKESLLANKPLRKPEINIVDWSGEARALGRKDPRIPKMSQKLWGIHSEWLERKRDE